MCSARQVGGNAAIALLVFTGGVFMLAALQRQLIYFPETAPEAALLDAADHSGLQAWRDDRGDIIGWRAGNGDGPRVVVFHGNAGHALYRQYFAAGFLALGRGWQVYLFEYPGYGARPGSPSEERIKDAAADALQTLLQQDPQPLYLVGESLGSGVATALAARFGEQVAGVLLVTPFTSLTEVAKTHYSFLPVDALLRERYDSQQALAGYRGPVAFLIAGEDEIVPAVLGHQLHDGYRGPKWLHEQAGARHNTLDFNPSAAWWRQVTRFWASY